MDTFRIEKDSMGEMKVPKDALWAAQTQRAVENFPVSALRFPRSFIKSLGMVKLAAAIANEKLGNINVKERDAIVAAAQEVIDGNLDSQFVVDIFQTGSGTSTNMNANEVIATRATQFLRLTLSDAGAIHPNDHVNRSQSSNDVIPTAIHVATTMMLTKELFPAMKELHKSLEKKVTEFSDIMKIGRTHLQDATPLTLGQEFSGYASMIDHNMQRVINCLPHISELAIGGTAVGTGINAHPNFAPLLIEELNRLAGCVFLEATNHFEAQGARDAIVEVSGVLKNLAVSLMKIANDIRFLGSGPRCGLGELLLPEVQPGSSIMPGKINPVIAESLTQVAAQVIGNDATITVGGLSGNFELNVMMPVMAYNLLQSIHLLTNGITIFRVKLIDGLQANKERCEEMVEKSLAMVTSLTPLIGYNRAAELAHSAHKEGKTIRQLLRDKKILSDEEIENALDPWNMV